MRRYGNGDGCRLGSRVVHSHMLSESIYMYVCMSEKNATERCTLRKWVNPATHTVLQSKNCWRPFLSPFRGPSDSHNKSSVVALLNPFGSELARMVTVIRWQLVTLCI